MIRLLVFSKYSALSCSVAVVCGGFTPVATCKPWLIMELLIELLVVDLRLFLLG